ncbi:MAG: MBL fold metallo-hydrolase [Desulfobacteraceae bacterium]|nr:MBL fold metallo-hydrolase [Desulfobacteraceae bacterium]
MTSDNKNISICPLASGSKGNSLFVSWKNNSILIDAGLSGIEIERRLESKSLSPESLTAIIVTHEHSDHIRGVGILSRRYNIPVYINKNTYERASSLGKLAGLQFFECGNRFKIDNMEISPFTISHDAVDPAGFTLEYKAKKIGIATDLGIATNLVKEHLKKCSFLYLEANHDPDMLINGPYPWHLKQRIKGRQGHLSNMDSKELLRQLNNKNLKHVTLAHLSEENNTPEKAYNAAKAALNSSDVTIEVAMPHKPGKLTTL